MIATRRGGGDESGSATVVGAGAVLALLSIFAVTIQLGAATITRHRAEAAGDLAALAAAANAASGAERACAVARRVTDRMTVGLVACELRGWQAIVSVEATPPGVLARFGTARATARAGPADAHWTTRAQRSLTSDERPLLQPVRNQRPSS